MASEIILIRHGETAWSVSGQHTSRTDLPLTEEGRTRAAALGRLLAGTGPGWPSHPEMNAPGPAAPGSVVPASSSIVHREFALVLSSPMRRALETCNLAGYEPLIDPNLHEWDYGAYEGLTSAEIRKSAPEWTIWTGTPPGGESADQVGARADLVIRRALGVFDEGDVAIFGHGHMLRVLASRWLGLAPESGRFFALDTGTLSSLGWEHSARVLRRWNLSA